MATVAPEAEMVLDVRNPRTGEADFRLPVSSAEEVAAKAARLRANQRGWEALGVAGRCGVMARWLGAVKARAADIGEADAVDTGGCHTSYIQGFITMGNIGGWLEDAPRAFESLKWQGMSTSMPSVEIESQVVAYPIVSVISPWNAPLMLALLDAVPALFAGSAVLLKPSEVTPRVIEALFETVREVPELAAVFDYVTGPGQVGQAVIAEADTVCFTGSVPTGRKVAVACAERLIPCNLELGGKDPCIVTASADLDRAATSVLRGAVYATGQVCYSVERVYVHESVHDAFVAKLVALAQAVRLNADNPRAGHIGALTDLLLRLDELPAAGFTVTTAPSPVAVDVAAGDEGVATALRGAGFRDAATARYFRAVPSLRTSNGPLDVTTTVLRFTSAQGATTGFAAMSKHMDSVGGTIPVSTGPLGDAGHGEVLEVTDQGVTVAQASLVWRSDDLVSLLVVRERDTGSPLQDALLVAHPQVVREQG